MEPKIKKESLKGVEGRGPKKNRLESRRGFLGHLKLFLGGYLGYSIFRNIATIASFKNTEAMIGNLKLLKYEPVSNPEIFSKPLSFFGNVHVLEAMAPILQEYLEIFKNYEVFVLENMVLGIKNFDKSYVSTDEQKRLIHLNEEDFKQEVTKLNLQLPSSDTPHGGAERNNWWFTLMAIMAARQEKPVIYVDPTATVGRAEDRELENLFTRYENNLSFIFTAGIISAAIGIQRENKGGSDLLTLPGLSAATLANIIGDDPVGKLVNLQAIPPEILRSDFYNALVEISYSNYREFVSVALLRKLLKDDEARGGNLKNLNAAALYGAGHYRIMAIYRLAEEVVTWKLKIYEKLFGLNERKAIIQRFDKQKNDWKTLVVNFHLTT